MKSSLLAHLYSRIKGSPEDVATLSLCYILDNSESARRGFNNYLSQITGIDSFPELNFRTQVVGSNNERPDISGYDSKNNELVLCESKFWAGLTENQPLGYIKRLKGNGVTGEKALVFICPNERKISLWGELLRLCDIGYPKFDDNSKRYSTMVDGTHMAIVSWRSITDLLMQILSSEHFILVGDLQQLQGLCDEMDEQAFLPFTPEDFGVNNAKRIVSYYKIVDKVADILKHKIGASSKGLKAAAQYAGYTKYLKIKNYGIVVEFNCSYWMDLAETPFWVSIKEIKNNEWVYAKKVHEKLGYLENTTQKRMFFSERYERLVFLLYAPPYKCEDDVVKGLYEEIKYIFKLLDETGQEL